jgi:hypothetical protein
MLKPSYKILHIANFKTEHNAEMFYNIDAKIQHGLIEQGHYVHAFDYKYMVRKSNIFNTTRLSHTKIHQQLTTICEQLKPDIILLGHVHIDLQVLKKLKSISNSKVAMWFVDPINEPHRLDHFNEMYPALDHVYVTTGGEYLKQLSEACPGPIFTFMPNISLQSIEHARPNWAEFEHDYIFCASNSKYPAREQFIHEVIEKTPELKAKLAACMGFPGLRGELFLTELRNSLMGINYSKYNDIYLYSSDRIAQLTGAGCLTLTPETPGSRLLFPEGTVVYCNTTEDFITQLKYYAAHPEQAIEIAKKGYELAHTLFEANHVTKLWLEQIATDRFDAPWSDEIYVNGAKK